MATIINTATGERVTVTDVHPIANLFPLLPDAELADLAADIGERGLLHPVVLDVKGRLLDGRNRLAACEQVGVQVEATVYEGDDPDGYALAVNIARRHLNKGQQAMIAARALFVSNNDQTATARAAGISQSRIAYAATVLSHAPDLADAVVAGACPLDAAYATARGRKEAADSDESRMAELQAKAPDLADLVAEERISLPDAMASYRQREEDHQAAIRRAVGRLEQLVSGWVQLRGLAASPDRDELLAALNDHDRAQVIEIEAIYARGTDDE